MQLCICLDNLFDNFMPNVFRISQEFVQLVKNKCEKQTDLLAACVECMHGLMYGVAGKIINEDGYVGWSNATLSWFFPLL